MPLVPQESAWLLYADHIDQHGCELFRLACDRDLEGGRGKLFRFFVGTTNLAVQYPRIIRGYRMGRRSWPAAKIGDCVIQDSGQVRNFIPPAQENGHGTN